MEKTIVASVERNRQVKDYIDTLFGHEPKPISYALEHSKAAGLKTIQVPASVGKMLSLIAKLVKPKRILEIGTLGGYSTLWLAEALVEGGKLLTIECEENHVRIAEENFIYAKKQEEIEIRKGCALPILEEMIANKEESFDLIFIDADKSEYPKYLQLVLQLSHSGTVILSDNLIPKRGDIGNPDPRDKEALAIYAFNQMLANHPGLETILLTTIVGEKGRIDSTGLTIVR